MRRVMVNEYGDVDVLEICDVPKPEPGAGEVLIKVKVAGINYADIMQRNGLYPGGPAAPYGAGFEVAGIVEAVGEGVTAWSAGDEVMSFCDGGYSDYVIAPQIQVMPKPEQLNWHEAAAIPCQYLTAYHALITLGNLQEGQTVLLQAAAGGLGTMMVQIARNLGANVIGTASTDEKCALIKSLGCQHPVKYTEQDFVAVTKDLTMGKGCDLIIETVGGHVFDKSMKCLKSRGMLVTLGVASKEINTISSVQLLAKNHIVAGLHLNAYLVDQAAMANAVRDLHTWLLDGKLKIIAEHSFPLEQVREAHQAISDRKTLGKVVLTVND